MDRRDFLTAAGGLVVGGIAMNLLGGCTEPFTLSSLKAGDIKESYQTQVLVLGGGPAGVCAAIAAARQGVKVMIVEQGGALGGMATLGVVAPFMTCYDTTGEQMIIKGIFEEIVDRMVALGGALHPSGIRKTTGYSAWITDGHDHLTPFDAETLKYVLDCMCAEAGVKVLFHANFVNPILAGDRAAGAVILTKGGLEAVRADIVIDCTGDGDYAARAGAPTEFGNPRTGRVQPSTLFFHINNVESRLLERDVESKLHTFRRIDGVSHRALHWHVLKAVENGDWDISRRSVNIYKGVRDDEWAVNTTRIARVDATNSEDLTRGEIEGRRQVKMVMDFFHKYVPGCKNATLKCTGSTLGIRESRHILGEYVLQVDDLLNGVVSDDAILVASNSVDVHGRLSDNSTEYITVQNGRWYGVPYRTLVPQRVENLLVAGRALSATSDAAGAVRVMPPCMAMGQAAGVAAALAAKGGTTPRNIDPTHLRKVLLENGVFLG